MVQDAACKKINNVLVDTSDLAISQYSLLGQTPPPSAPDSPATLCRDSSPAVKDQTQSAGALVDQLHVLNPQHHGNTTENLQQDPKSLYPSIVVTEQLNGSPSQKGKTSEEVHLPNDVHQTSAESDVRQEDGDRPEAPVNSVGHEPSASHINAECFQGPSSPELSTSEHLLESFEPQPSASSPVNIRLGFLSQAIAALPGFPAQHQGPTDRAVYLSGEMKDNWEVEKVEKQEEASQTEVQGRRREEAKGTGGGQEKMGESAKGGEMESLGKSVEDIRDSEATERSVATKKEVEEEKKEDKKQEVEEEEDNGRQGECREDKEKEKEEEQKAKDNDRGRGEKHKEDKEQKKESKEEKQMDDGGRGRECKEEKEEKEKVEEQKEKEDDGGRDGEKQEGEEEQKESKEKQEEQKEDGGKGGEDQEEKEKGKKDEDGGRRVTHEEDKEEQKEIEGQGGQDAEEKEEHKEEKKDDDDDGGHKERQEEQKTESEEEKQQEIGGRVLEQVVPDCPLGEPQPDSIAAIRELVSEVIEVEVEISPDAELPASCNNAL